MSARLSQINRARPCPICREDIPVIGSVVLITARAPSGDERMRLAQPACAPGQGRHWTRGQALVAVGAALLVLIWVWGVIEGLSAVAAWLVTR